MIKKAGTILINKDTKCIGLVKRKKHNDISFPKGHVEGKESLEECAIRETREETGRDCKIISEPVYIDEYINKEGKVNVYYYLAMDLGSINNNTDEELIWVEINKVKDYLSIEKLIVLWNEVYPIVIEKTK